MTTTALSAVDVAKLTAHVLGDAGYKRSATKDAAAKRFGSVYAEKFGENFAARDVADILACETLEAAIALLDKCRGLIEAEQAHYEAEEKAREGELAWGPGGLVRNAPALSDEEKEGVADLDAKLRDAAPVVSAGLARLRANSDAEAIREATIADADKARAEVALPSFGGKAAAVAKVAPAPAPKAQAAKAPKADLAETVITGIVANPKKPGSKASTIFALYYEGITVADFIAAVVKAGFSAEDAKANVSWDRRKGFIQVGPKAEGAKAA